MKLVGFPPFPTTSNGVPAVLYCFFYLYLAVAGAGPWSLDARIARSRGRVDSAGGRSTYQ